ncbi:TonB-dependent receptor [Sphingosinicella rhizophila]|uniref:TonB-dependent receptor n=1 Tax=Sphingosinicella rhizophila TaxID=3050082 RepID=A0ABU3QB03_9SPHN|nr:TonB-dependent receptor [Sphingosinicella sp. GR2756]MDT9600591.1 TonB-dependent receptor [Sphingosinicella sp. GR2756]
MTGAKFWLAGVAFLPGIVHAQTVENVREPVGPDNDIVVTAQRYEQRLQDVPISITAVTDEEIQARNAKLLADLQYAVPGLSMFGYGVGASYTQLRGVSNISGAATVGIYYDETPFTLSSVGLDPSAKLLDMERVEVLRGPQATLYGEGSMGGTIRYIPEAPQLDRIGGWAEGQWSDTKDGANNYVLEGAVNLPIVTDKIGVRIAASYERVGGWIDSVTTGERDINSADLYTVRGTLRLKPTDRLDVSLLGLYQKSAQDNQNFGVDQTTMAALETPLRDRTIFIQAKASYDFDFATLTGIAGYIDRDNSNTLDITSLYGPFLPLLGIPPGFITAIGLETVSEFKVYNGELRLASQGDGRLRWALGATFRNLEQTTTQSSTTAPNSLPFVLLLAGGPLENKSHAVYAELGYKIVPNLTATVGARYYSEHKTQRIESSNLGATSLDIGDGKFHSFNPRVNLSYEFSREAMIYANVAKGFRSGGFNLTSAGGGVIPVPPTYEPDEIWTYEAGGKLALARNRLVLDASVYRSIWSDVQAVTTAPGSALVYITNSGRVTGWGVDFSATARPVRALTLSGTFGWNNLAYTTTTADKFEGDPVDGAARLSYSASLDYRPMLTQAMTGIFRIDFQHAGRGQITVRNYVPALIRERPERDLLNVRAGVGFGPVELTVFANNLFNEKAPILIGPYGAIAENIEQRPRTIGISASTRF